MGDSGKVQLRLQALSFAMEARQPGGDHYNILSTAETFFEFLVKDYPVEEPWATPAYTDKPRDPDDEIQF